MQVDPNIINFGSDVGPGNIRSPRNSGVALVLLFVGLGNIRNLVLADSGWEINAAAKFGLRFLKFYIGRRVIYY